MKLRNLLLRVALGLILSVIAAQAAPTTINALPYTITVPGTYILAADLMTAQDGIFVSSPFTGTVIIDLKGHTITGSNPGGSSTGNGIFIRNASSANPVTIRNGTLRNFGIGLNAQSINRGGFLTNILITKITFAQIALNGVFFQNVNDSSVTACTFTTFNPPPLGSTLVGINDQTSQGGNRYSQNSFPTPLNGNLLSISNNTSPLEIENCLIENPANPKENDVP